MMWMPKDDQGVGVASVRVKMGLSADTTTAQVETLAIHEESRPKLEKKRGQEIVGKERVLSQSHEGGETAYLRCHTHNA